MAVQSASGFLSDLAVETVDLRREVIPLKARLDSIPSRQMQIHPHILGLMI
jgi:hypothetical protein